MKSKDLTLRRQFVSRFIGFQIKSARRRIKKTRAEMADLILIEEADLEAIEHGSQQASEAIVKRTAILTSVPEANFYPDRGDGIFQASEDGSFDELMRECRHRLMEIDNEVALEQVVKVLRDWTPSFEFKGT